MRTIIRIITALLSFALSLGAVDLRTSNLGIEFIRSFEGCYLRAYKCPAGVWTIGVGNTSKAKPGMTITKETAIIWLQEDCRRFERHVNTNCNRQLNQTKYDALVSFTFNCGYRIRGNLRTALNIGEDETVCSLISQYVHAKGKVLKGLERRRKAEIKLYKNGLYR